MLNYLKAIRIHHWAKNVLIFLPVIMAHRFFVPTILVDTCLAYLAFCLAASAGYLFNDVIDLTGDKLHQFKSKRPLAAGALTVRTYYSMSVILLSSAAFICSFLPLNFSYVLALYFILSLSYSYLFKSILALDVLVLAGFYAFRVFAGSVATNIEVSQWLLSFCLFFFLSLALGKRVAELINASEEKTNNRRAYKKSDLNVLSQLGVCSGMISVLVLAFYVTSTHVAQLYTNPQYLWGLCLILIYWISRYWIFISRAEIEEDPVVFALHDRASYISGVLILFLVLLSI